LLQRVCLAAEASAEARAEAKKAGAAQNLSAATQVIRRRAFHRVPS